MNNQDNIKQKEIIESFNGIYVIDAGAGTGKTHAITERYINILTKQGINLNEILLLTFTTNASQNMREKIINKLIKVNSNINALDANIFTFHSFCKQILSSGVEDVTKYLDIFLQLNKNFQIFENEIMEKIFFKRVYNKFKKTYSKYSNEFIIINDNYSDIFSIIKKLLSKGVFPKKEGWCLNGEDVLKGNFNKFFEKVLIINTINGKEKKSALLKKFLLKSSDKHYYSFDDYWNDKNIVDEKDIKQAFFEDRFNWINFIHDLYYLYILSSVKENRISFDFLIMFAFLELYNNEESRKLFSYKYLMIDEFQDTNEMQFLLTLLLMKNSNLCVVGDWKQGIYGFRNASIDNILNFKDKLNYYKEILNQDKIRINFDIFVNEKEFDINYRSSQKILDFSEQALFAKGNLSEEISSNEIEKNLTKLKANFDYNDCSNIYFYKINEKEDEIKFILNKIQDIVDNNDYKIKIYQNNGSFSYRTIKYNDIVILSRTRSFSLNLQKLGLSLGIPINYEGGLEIWRTKEALLLLSMLRIFLNKNDERGFITILDYYNYSLGDKKYILEKKDFPKDILNFRKILFKYKKNIICLASKIFDFFNINNMFSNGIISYIGNLFSNNLISIENLITFIEESIEEESIINIDTTASENAVTVQTIHSSKGLEYPVVFLANCNLRIFPSTKSDSGLLRIDKTFGLRSSKVYNNKNRYHAVFDNWHTNLLKCTNITEYDEERRLLYVALTRAKYFLFLTAYNPSNFFNDLSSGYKVEEINATPNLSIKIKKDEIENFFPKLNYNKRSTIYSAHDLMRCKIPETGKGKDFGLKIHNFAEMYALGINVFENYAYTENIKKFINQLNAKELKTEIECALPINNILIRGIIDLLAIYDDKIIIIDYKSDETKLNHNEYIKQISVYYHAVLGFYNKPTFCKIFYTSLNEKIDIEPLSLESISKLLTQ